MPSFRPAVVCKNKDGGGDIYLIDTNKDLLASALSHANGVVTVTTLKALVREETKSHSMDELPQLPYRTEEDCVKWLEVWWRDITIHSLPRPEALERVAAFVAENKEK